LTTVESTKTMTDPRMLATRTSRLRDACGRESILADRTRLPKCFLVPAGRAAAGGQRPLAAEDLDVRVGEDLGQFGRHWPHHERASFHLVLQVLSISSLLISR
jgi:hypothetical protein